MILAKELMRRAGVQLLDEEHVRWPLPELATWIDEGVSAIVVAKPSAASVTMSFDVAKGTKQRLPDDQGIVQLLDITRNLNVSADGAGGRMIRPTTRSQLDTQMPRWHDPSYQPFQAEVRQFVFDELLPREFYVFPGNNGTGIVEIVVSQLPPTVVSQATGDTSLLATWAVPVGLPDEYQAALLEYLLYRAFDKEDPASAPNRAVTHYQAFATAVGIKSQVETIATPNRARP